MNIFSVLEIIFWIRKLSFRSSKQLRRTLQYYYVRTTLM